jgi:hypothetical protein
MFKKGYALRVVLALLLAGAIAVYAAPQVIILAHLNPPTPFDIATAQWQLCLKMNGSQNGGQLLSRFIRAEPWQ